MFRLKEDDALDSTRQPCLHATVRLAMGTLFIITMRQARPCAATRHLFSYRYRIHRAEAMAQTWKLFFLCVVLLLSGASAREDHEEDGRRHDREPKHEDEDEHGHKKKQPSPFVLKEPVEIVKTQAGKIQVLPGPKELGILARNNIGLSIINMEPKALLLPQYLDASCVLYVHKGNLTLGWVEEDQLLKRGLETGDVYALPGGIVFYILNTDEGQRLRVYGLCDTSESLEPGHFQSFFVGGGVDPPTILSGFDEEVLAAALKVAPEDVKDVLSSQTEGPIVYTTESQYDMLKGNSNVRDPPKPYNLLRKKPAFENDNGRSIAVDGEEFSPLKDARVGVFAVSLKPGAMLAPHWNPRAAEVAFVTEGRGSIQVSYPNGTNALNKEVDEATVFFVPRYFPMCQIASRDGPFEFVGFSTSARPNRPQFLTGSNSVLKALDMDTLSIAFGVPGERMHDLIDSQNDAVILPGFVEEDETSYAL